jgi:hypothetical protein
MPVTIGAQGFTAEADIREDGGLRLVLRDAHGHTIAWGSGYAALPAEPLPAEQLPAEPLRAADLPWHERHGADPSWPDRASA